MNQAIFLDRDGVINYNIFNDATGEWESPHRPEDFKLFPWAIKSLKNLQDLELQLFLISNQPSFAKGKASFENITAIHEKLHTILTDNKIYFSDYFYCYHHPKGIVPELSIKCECRKPGTFFIKKAAKEHSLNLKTCWIIGDRDSDTLCGRNAGLRTIQLIDSNSSRQGTTDCRPDFKANDLRDAVDIIKTKVDYLNNKE